KGFLELVAFRDDLFDAMLRELALDERDEDVARIPRAMGTPRPGCRVFRAVRGFVYGCHDPAVASPLLTLATIGGSGGRPRLFSPGDRIGRELIQASTSLRRHATACFPNCRGAGKS